MNCLPVIVDEVIAEPNDELLARLAAASGPGLGLLALALVVVLQAIRLGCDASGMPTALRLAGPLVPMTEKNESSRTCVEACAALTPE